MNFDSSDSVEITNDGVEKKKKRQSQQKTLRLDEDLFQAVKLVARSLDMTEQDFIVEAIKKETNLHVNNAKKLIAAQIASLPSLFE